MTNITGYVMVRFTCSTGFDGLITYMVNTWSLLFMCSLSKLHRNSVGSTICCGLQNSMALHGILKNVAESAVCCRI